MSNDFSDVIPTMYAALNRVSREQVGLISAVSRDVRLARAAVGQEVRSPVAPQMTVSNFTPAATPPAGADRTVGYSNFTLTKSRKVSWNVTGEEELSLGENATPIEEDTFAEAFRAIANEIEADLASTYVEASRAYGTAGTAPFGTAADFSDFANMHRILTDNGAPTTSRELVLGSAAIANIRGKQSSLFKANEAGSDELLRRGVIGMVEGFGIHESAGIKLHTKGTATGLDAAGGEPIGETSIALDGGDGGTLLAGDVVSFAGDTTNKYVTTTGFTAASGTAVLGAPGLRNTLADTVEMTIGNSYTANMAFSRDAVVFAMRPPAMPKRGDSAKFRQTMMDPFSRLSFEVAYYDQYGQGSWEVQAVWGWDVPNPRHLALLLG